VYIDNTSDWYPKRKENRKKRLKELQQVIESRKEWQRGRPLVEATISPSFTTIGQNKDRIEYFCENCPVMSKVLNMRKTCQNGEATQTSC
jgi:exoribonuclease II